MIIGNNIPALLAQLQLKSNDRKMSAALQRLSTGSRINSVKDDAAGMAIASKLRYQVTGTERASQNSTHGISLIQTAEGALSEVHNMLQRMRELAVQSANDTLTKEDRRLIQSEIDDLTDEITAITNRTEFNRIKLLSGEAARVSSAGAPSSTTPPQLIPDNTITTTTYISENMPAGTLFYDIKSVGLPAEVIGTPVASPPPNPQSEGVITINGIRIEIASSDSYDMAKSKIIDACSYAGIRYQELEDTAAGTVTVLLATNQAGSGQFIDISGDAAFLAKFGMQPSYSEGTNAVLENIRMDDQNGNPIHEFNSSLAYSADGNRISIVTASGNTVQMNIQVRYNESILGGVRQTKDVTADYLSKLTPEQQADWPAGKLVYEALPESYTYGDGTTPVADPNTTPNPSPTARMLKVESYGPIRLQIGQGHNMSMDVQIPRLTAETLGLVEFKGGNMYRQLNYQTPTGSALAIERTNEAIQMISHIRANLGAHQNRLEYTVRNLDTISVNTESARSRIQDTDMARESTMYTQYNVIHQAGLAILGQANQRPQMILSLLQ